MHDDDGKRMDDDGRDRRTEDDHERREDERTEDKTEDGDDGTEDGRRRATDDVLGVFSTLTDDLGRTFYTNHGQKYSWNCRALILMSCL